MRKPLRAVWGSPDQPLKIGSLEIPCYVLEDSTRVLSGRGMQGALALGQSHGALLKRFLAQNNIKPFVNDKLAMALESPINFVRPGRGGKLAVGYEATILADICDAILDAREKGSLTKQQKMVADQCEILVRAFARVGIIALVDEATGYQEVRSRQALEKILEKFLNDEFGKWAKRFPDDFYKEMFRLRKWQYMPFNVKRPGVVGRYTNDLVYERVAPGILEELRRRNPRNERGQLKSKHHQWLTEDIGHPKLQEHLSAVIALMKASSGWRQFYSMMNRALPRYGHNLMLPYPEPEDEEEEG